MLHMVRKHYSIWYNTILSTEFLWSPSQTQELITQSTTTHSNSNYFLTEITSIDSQQFVSNQLSWNFGFKCVDLTAASLGNLYVTFHRLAFKLAFCLVYSFLINKTCWLFQPLHWISTKYLEGGWSGTFGWVPFVMFFFSPQMLSITPMSRAPLRNEQSQDNLSPSSVHAHTYIHTNTQKQRLSTLGNTSCSLSQHCSFLSFNLIIPPSSSSSLFFYFSALMHSWTCGQAYRYFVSLLKD